VPDSSHLVTSKEASCVEPATSSQPLRVRSESFPRSDDEVAKESNGNENLRAKVVAMLQIRLAQSSKLARLQKRVAFDRMVLHHQSSFMEQLLMDNENLLDQIQALQLQQQHLATLETINIDAENKLSLYNQESVRASEHQNLGRNNSK